MQELNSADGWLAQPEYKGIMVMDPDGWDRKNFDVSWAELITKDEFEKRLCYSTCMWPRDLLRQLAGIN